MLSDQGLELAIVDAETCMGPKTFTCPAHAGDASFVAHSVLRQLRVRDSVRSRPSLPAASAARCSGLWAGLKLWDAGTRM